MTTEGKPQLKIIVMLSSLRVLSHLVVWDPPKTPKPDLQVGFNCSQFCAQMSCRKFKKNVHKRVFTC